MDYYLIRPSSDPKGCVLVLHAWWGLTPFFKGFCDRLAAEGFLTLAPDLYDGKTALTREEADKLRKKMGKAKATAYILDSLDALRNSASLHQGKIGLIGFSLGAYWALWLAESRPADIAAVTLFYGTRGGEYLNGNMAFQGHFAETDEFEPASSVKSLERTLRKAGKSHEFHFYPNTRHWFFESNQVGYYDEVASQLSWQRTVAFLKSHLVPA